MGASNARLYERLGFAGFNDAGLVNGTTSATGWVAANKANRWLALLNLGATDTTVDFVIQKATSSGGAGATTQVAATQLSSTDDNKKVVLETLASALGDGYTHVRALATVGSGSVGANVACCLIAGDAQYDEEYKLNAAAVAEIKTG